MSVIADAKEMDSTHYDAFLSHNWGLDTHGRDNHERVKTFCQELQNAGLETWCDEYDMEGNILESMASGIDTSRKAIIFVTEQYIKKANGEAEKKTKDNVYREFNYISNHFQTWNIIVVVMEESARDVKNWRGAFGLTLAGQLYADFSADSNLEECLEKVKAKINQCSPDAMKKIAYEDGSFYEGPVNDENLRHGYGRLTDPHGNVYEGKFIDGEQVDPKASIHFQRSQVKYVGLFKGGSIVSGKRGKVELPDGSVMEGKFVVASYEDGHLDGVDVTFTNLTESAEDIVYTGTIKANKIAGRGKMKYANGDVYEGEWQEGEKHGEGVMTYTNGDVYSGSWENDVRHGHGELELASGDKYEGNFDGGMMNGKGAYFVADGSVYRGDFVKDLCWGSGVFISADNRITCGEWKADKLHGKGYREYANGDKYYGQFQYGKRHGKGKMMFSSGALYAGKWVRGSRSEGVYDFETEDQRNRKKEGKSLFLGKSKNTLYFFTTKGRNNTLMVPKKRHGKAEGISSCSKARAVLATEEFLTKAQGFMNRTMEENGCCHPDLKRIDTESTEFLDPPKISGTHDTSDTNTLGRQKMDKKRGVYTSIEF
jgi:hypothetical protein